MIYNVKKQKKISFKERQKLQIQEDLTAKQARLKYEEKVEADGGGFSRIYPSRDKSVQTLYETYLKGVCVCVCVMCVCDVCG